MNHGSSDNTVGILEALKKQYSLDMNRIDEKFEGTMDDMKGKYYKELLKQYQGTGMYMCILDWDEVFDDALIENINQIDFSRDVYYINRHTYLLSSPIDRNAYLPLLFQIEAVEVAPFETFHKLYNVKSTNTMKLSGILHHYSYTSMRDLIQKNSYYAEHEAQALFMEKPHIARIMVWVRCLYEGSIYCIYTLFRHYNFLTIEGWLYSWNWYTYKIYKYLFYLELQYASRMTA